MDRFENNLADNTLNTLRLVIINAKMPLSEGPKAGAKYCELWENGEIHALMEQLMQIHIYIIYLYMQINFTQEVQNDK